MILEIIFPFFSFAISVNFFMFLSDIRVSASCTDMPYFLLISMVNSESGCGVSSVADSRSGELIVITGMSVSGYILLLPDSGLIYLVELSASAALVSEKSRDNIFPILLSIVLFAIFTESELIMSMRNESFSFNSSWGEL